MRLNKILAAVAATTVIASGALAQFGLYGENGNLNSGFTTTPFALGDEAVPFHIRMDVPDTVAGAPVNGGGSYGVIIDFRYLDIRFWNTITNQSKLLSDLMQASSNTSTIVNIGVYTFRGISNGQPLVGAAASGGQWQSVGQRVRLKIAFQSTSLSDTNPGPADPWVRTGTSAQRRLPELIIKWNNIYNDFGLNNPYQVSNDGSFVFGFRDDFSDFRSYPTAVNGHTFTVVPEPASMIALGTGLAGLLALRRRRSN